MTTQKRHVRRARPKKAAPSVGLLYPAICSVCDRTMPAGYKGIVTRNGRAHTSCVGSDW